MPKRRDHAALAGALSAIDVRLFTSREYQIAQRFKRGGNVSHAELELLRAVTDRYTPN